MKPGLTALGIECALGSDCKTVLRRAIAGDVSGMRPWAGVLPDGASPPFGFAPIPDAEAAEFPSRVAALIACAARQIAPELAELRRRFAPERLGVVIGSSNSTMEEFTANPESIDMAAPARFLRDFCGFRGPAFAISTACSSSAKAFASARRLLESGVCDAVAVGGADSRTRIVENGFWALESLSARLSEPMGRNRDGINLGEGAALFIMEREGGEIALAGIGESSDAHHMTAPDPEGRGAIASMRAALADAAMPPEAIGYINLHGTGTPYNDSMEARAVAEVFGLGVPCSSTKPMTGHALGAAGAIEAGLCWLMLRGGGALLPHVLGGEADPALPALRLAQKGERAEASAVLSNSFAFGGSNASVVIARRRDAEPAA